MPINILMPALSPTMEEGKLAKWLVAEGDSVRSGDVIAEIETDKATMEVEAVDEGIVGKILVAEGSEGVPVNKLIAVLLEDGEDASAIAAATDTAAGPPPPPGPPAAKQNAAPQASAIPRPSNAMPGRIIASPLARRLASKSGIDLSALSGSGPHGRIVRRDVETAASRNAGLGDPASGSSTATASTAVAPARATAGQMLRPMADDKILALYEPGSFEVVPHDAMRRIIAERLTLSKQTIPHFYLNVDCRLDEMLSARKRLNQRAAKEGPRAFKLSVNDFIIKAMALALQEVPAANATWTETGTLRHKRSDVGVAVAVEGGLFTPVIRHGDLKTLSEISNEMKDLAARARSKRLAPHEYQGGTTSISNLGMYGIKSFDAVINPPHATILAVGAGEKRAVIAGDRIEPAIMMSVTLSCDHRVVDGAVGADLLAAFKSFIEDPVRMLV